MTDLPRGPWKKVSVDFVGPLPNNDMALVFWDQYVEGIGKESIMLSMELAKTQCPKFEWFKDNYSLTISTQGCQTNTRKFNTKRT